MSQMLLTVLTAKLLYPLIVPALVNCYRKDAHLFLGGAVIFSSEGTTEGDPLAIAMFANASVPLMHQLKGASSVNQIWFVNEATAGGTLQSLKTWSDELEQIGPDFGYFANAPKSWLNVKEKHMTDVAKIFAAIQITKRDEGT